MHGRRATIITRLTGDGAAEALNRLAREQCKTKLLADINADMMVCEIEGWDQTAYLAELHALIAHFSPCPAVAS